MTITTVKELLQDNAQSLHLADRLNQMASSEEDLEILKKTQKEIEKRLNERAR